MAVREGEDGLYDQDSLDSRESQDEGEGEDERDSDVQPGFEGKTEDDDYEDDEIGDVDEDTKHRLNHLEVTPEEIDSKMEQLPERTEGDKTHGIAVVNGKEYPIQASGVEGPSKDIPRGTDGFNGNVRSHVEGHTAALMRQTGAKEGVLYINNPPCKPIRKDTGEESAGCNRMLPKMLPEGAKLRVIGPDGYDNTFTGLPDKPREK